MNTSIYWDFRICISVPLINAVMKYLNFRNSASKLETITCKFTKSHTLSEVFFEEFHYKRRTGILKNAFKLTASGDNCIFKIFLNGCFSKTAAKIYLFYKFYVIHVLYFWLWRHFKEERIFMNIFLSEGFGEKCKHTEVTLNFIQKQYFS